MTSALVVGLLLGFAAAAQPGPGQSYLLSEALRRGGRHAWPVAFAPLASDMVVGPLVLLGLTRLPQNAVAVLRIGGSLLLLSLAWGALAAVRRAEHEAPPRPSAATKSAIKAIGLGLLNPGVYLGWTFVLGPQLVASWKAAPANGVALLAGFYAAMVGSNLAIVILAASARGLGARPHKALVGLSAVVLAGFALWQLYVGSLALTSR